MISQKTAQETKKVMMEWAAKHKLTAVDALELLTLLARVPGNQSFKDSVQGLLKLFNDEMTGS